MSAVKCNCPWNPDSHAETCPIYMRDRIDALAAECEALRSERDARDWEMQAKGVEAVIYLVVSKADQDVLRRYADDMRIESKRIAAMAAKETTNDD